MTPDEVNIFKLWNDLQVGSWLCVSTKFYVFVYDSNKSYLQKCNLDKGYFNIIYFSKYWISLQNSHFMP